MFKSALIFCFFFVSFLNAQHLEIEYSAVLRQELSEDAKNEIMKDGEYGREQIKMNEEPDPATYKMLISGKESIFSYVEKISNEQDPNKPVIRHAPAGFGSSYHNLDEAIAMKDFNVYGKNYHSLDSLMKFNWKITNEKKEMLGFEVRKATAETATGNITAWYTPKIPVAHGPAEYWGLPGLILEIEFRHLEYPVTIIYYAETIKELKKSPKIQKPNKGEQIKESEINSIFEEANKARNELLLNTEDSVNKE
ncbi:MAG: GLPGLI family protein [Weeksellaceae bacterium]